MNYYIALINQYGEDWGLMFSTDYDFIKRAFEALAPPAGCIAELRETEEDIDTHLHYEVLDTIEG